MRNIFINSTIDLFFKTLKGTKAFKDNQKQLDIQLNDEKRIILRYFYTD